ncbi:MAG TPA: acylneuraminate cytidylyltransferase [Verrucomicrobiae bacterium]|nr:acylneuraminate cytidylyltransferase [Verrucomicrobiae bacterium]
MTSSVIAIIPARGGSKGIPRKNVLPLLGRPLLAHTIAHARSSPSIGRIFVSTDDDEIAAVAEAAGAEVVRRPAALSGDKAASELALLHVLDHLRDTERFEPELVVFLQATSPYRGDGDVEEAIATLRRERADSLFSGSVLHGFAWREGAGRLAPFNYDPVRRPMRQDLTETVLEENGSIYVFRPSVLREHGSRLGGRIAVFRQDPLHSLQVDEPGDLETLARLMGARPSASGSGARDAALAAVRLVVLDFDGVLTDNRVLVSGDGGEAVSCHRGDGWGIRGLREAGLEVIVLSTEKHPVVTARCRKLEVACLQGIADKGEALRGLARERGLEPGAVAYVGNDGNDAGCLRFAGVPIVVADAEAEVLPLARFVTTRPGGAGAIREVAGWILSARRKEPAAGG